MGRKFTLEILVDTVTIRGIKEPVQTSDLRLSIGLSELPVVHIKPSTFSVQPQVVQDTTVLFGGSGKLCEFTMTKAEFACATISILVVKELVTLNDHLILCLTPPHSFRDLVMSLPNCCPQPFVKRDFAFVDDRGHCSLYFRVTVEDSRQNPRLTHLSATQPVRHNKRNQSIINTPILHGLHESPRDAPLLPRPSSAPTTRSPMTYGALRSRTPLIH